VSVKERWLQGSAGAVSADGGRAGLARFACAPESCNPESCTPEPEPLNLNP
jgi:hypothetical protein